MTDEEAAQVKLIFAPDWPSKVTSIEGLVHGRRVLRLLGVRPAQEGGYPAGREHMLGRLGLEDLLRVDRKLAVADPAARTMASPLRGANASTS